MQRTTKTLVTWAKCLFEYLDTELISSVWPVNAEGG